MVGPIMVLLFFRGKSDEITDNPSDKRCFFQVTIYKKEVPYWGEHGTSTY